MKRVFDSFSIHDIERIYSDPLAKKSGIADFGNFDEGFCLKFSTKNLDKYVYIICFDSNEDKSYVLNLAREIKLEEQINDGIIENVDYYTKEKETLSGIFGKKAENQEKKDDLKLTDGYWIILQNWSQCNLKCGGGTTTLHRMCVPPKNRGKPCQGEAIIHKSCNTHECPNSINTQENAFNKKETEILKPIVKVMAFTDSPQRYTKCKIKETDMMIHLKSNDLNNLKNPILNGKNIIYKMGDIKIPSRVIMNNSTLTIYSGDHYETMYQTYNLKNSKMLLDKYKKDCLLLFEGSKKSVTLCTFNFEKNSKLLEDWLYDFDLFKNKCYRNIVHDIKSDQELNMKIQAKMVF